MADDEMVDLIVSHGGNPSIGWWNRISAHSLGWVSARNQDGVILGFVNVAWDGEDHAFLVDRRHAAVINAAASGANSYGMQSSTPEPPVASGFTSTSSRSSLSSTSMPAVSVGQMPV